MKAIVYHRYGSPDVLEYEEREMPSPGDEEVLLRVRAASVNPIDEGFIRATPYFTRIFLGLRGPRNKRLGRDVAGRVEAVGKNVTEFKPGDDVFGLAKGSFAEYVCTFPRALTRKPDKLSFEQAAAVPLAGLTALQGLRNAGKLQPGQRVLVNGASGGIGTFAVQIAKSFGAEVTGVCSTQNVELVQSVGADQVIDYTKENFTEAGQRYDMLFDLVGNHSFSARRRILTPRGICVLAGVGGAGMHPETYGRLFGAMGAAMRSPLVRQKFVMFMTKSDQKDLDYLSGLLQSGQITPVIDRRYNLEETAEAIRYLAAGHARGKVVITV